MKCHFSTRALDYEMVDLTFNWLPGHSYHCNSCKFQRNVFPCSIVPFAWSSREIYLDDVANARWDLHRWYSMYRWQEDSQKQQRRRSLTTKRQSRSSEAPISSLSLSIWFPLLMIDDRKIELLPGDFMFIFSSEKKVAFLFLFPCCCEIGMKKNIYREKRPNTFGSILKIFSIPSISGSHGVN